MLESGQDLDLPQSPLAESLMLERGDLLDRHALASQSVQGGSGKIDKYEFLVRILVLFV